MRLLLLLEPGLLTVLVALLVRYSHAPSTRTALAIGVVAAIAILPMALLFRRRDALPTE